MKKSALTTVFLVVLIDLLGFGIVLPLLPFYAETFHAGAIVIGLLYSIYSFAQLIFSPIWGGLSDRIGRRPIMLISTFGSVLAYIMFGLAGSLLVLFISRLLDGVMGGNISTAQAYVADVTSPEDRAKGMGMIGAAFGIGFVIGPAIATGLISPGFPHILNWMGLNGLAGYVTAHKYAMPGFFAAFMSACSFMMVVFKLPETVRAGEATVKDDARRIKRDSVFNPNFWRTLMEESQSGSRTIFLWLLVCVFMLSFGQSSIYSAFPLFAGKVLNMTPQEVGIQFFYIGMIAVVIQGGLIRHLTKKYAEEKIFLVGNILMVVGLALLSVVHSKDVLMVFLGLMAVGVSLNVPTMNSIISQKAKPEEVGKVMGTTQGISGMGRVIGPAWGGLLYSIAFFLPFIGTAIIISVTIIAGVKLWKDRKDVREKEMATTG